MWMSLYTTVETIGVLRLRNMYPLPVNDSNGSLTRRGVECWG